MPHTDLRPSVQVLGHFALSQDPPTQMLGHFALSQDPPSKCWDTLHCPRTLRPSVGTLRTVPRPLVLLLGHFVLSQDYLLKCRDTSHCPKTPRPSVATLRAVPRLPAQVLGHFVLSQDPPLKCWDTSHCPKTSRPSVGTLRAVPRLPAQVLGHFLLSQEAPPKVLGLFALSQDPSSKYWVTSWCPKTTCSSVGTVGSLLFWNSRVSRSLALGHLDHYPWFHHLSSSIKKFPQNPILLIKYFNSQPPEIASFY